ncbi:MAG: LCP family protein [Candidatus Moranbacteria bacterium]|nr:LCP family protein [Candidatus Moranbacteria bacterium]
MFNSKSSQNVSGAKKRFYQKKGFKIATGILLVLLLIGGVFAWKTNSVLTKISGGGILGNLSHIVPGINNELKGEKDGRINVAILGMRGADLPGGGTLADSIVVISILLKENKVSMISVPRDLYVTVPGTQDQQKINAVHAYGEQDGKDKGLENMKIVLGNVLGIPIHYAASINFAGFTQLVDAIGGVDITLDQPFDESMQFNEEHVCDSFFTIRTGNWENKIERHTKHNAAGVAYVVKTKVPKYPLCTAPKDTLECGGDFKLPAGKQTLNGANALCYVRSRKTSSDFERAKRQQQVIQLVKDKMLSIGTLADFNKLNGILNSLGDNVRTDMQAWEMQKFYELYKTIPTAQIYQRVLENSDEGLLYNPPEGAAGYILLPIGDNYDKIHEMVKNIFTLPAQSDIKPK